MNVTTSSKRFSLNLNDFWKGLIVAIGGAVVQTAMSSLEAGSLTFDWNKIAITGLSAGLAYLAKNFFDKPKIVVTDVHNDTIDAVKDGVAKVEVKQQ
jgi:hypothetical protein